MKYFETPSVTVYNQNCLEGIKQLPDQSVNCCVTSPPYFGLRDYGHAEQFGLEETPEAFIAKLVELFREIRRVLTDDGTIWVNIGDSYNAHPGQRKVTDKAGKKQVSMRGSTGCASRSVKGLKPKDLIGIPWRFAFALQADGWYLRQDIIWHKPNPMPESVTDRCTKAHEYIFLLSKSSKYFYDSDAVKEMAQPRKDGVSSDTCYTNSVSLRNDFGRHKGRAGFGTSEGLRNRRFVWTVSSQPYPEAHFATFPPDLITPCILAGSPSGGVVLDPFAGSGTTLQVAKDLGRKAIGFELNPDYCKLIAKRCQQLTIFDA